MPLATINGAAASANADVVINAKSYKAIFNDATVTADQDQIDATTFASEPGTEWEPGRLTITYDLAGFLKQGSDVSGPLIPPPQNVPMTVQYATGCTISQTVNFLRATARRIASQLATLTGQARGTGTLTKAWVIS